MRERYLWELYDPTRTDDPRSPISPARSAPSCTTGSRRRSIRSPSSVVTFAYLGAPRTTRQSRTMSLLGAIGAVVGAARPRLRRHDRRRRTRRSRSLLPYLGLVAAFVLGYLAISRGVIIEPPAFVTNAINADRWSASPARRRA